VGGGMDIFWNNTTKKYPVNFHLILPFKKKIATEISQLPMYPPPPLPHKKIITHFKYKWTFAAPCYFYILVPSGDPPWA